MQKTLIIGIAGGSGSGKSTIAELIMRTFPGQVALMRHDDYYKAQEGKTLEQRARQNYDCPDAFETDLLARHLQELREGRAVECPTYDYSQHNRAAAVRRVEPAPVVLVDGILVLAEKVLRDMMDIRIFVDTDADVRILRRLKRDINERKRTVESVMEQYMATVKPMHEAFVEPSKKYAHVIIPEGGHNTVALEMLTTEIRSRL